MAVTQNTYTGNGATVLYSFTFPYLETTDVKVTINGTPTTAYTFANATTIQFNTAPANGAAIRIYRDTDDASLAATFYSGSAIRAQDLNDNFTQNLYVTQEVNNNSVNIDGSNPMVGPLNMNGFQITNLPVPAVDTNAATKKYVDDRFGNLDIPGHTRWRKVATASQTTFSGTGDYGGVLAYSPTREQVYINGALQQRSVDYAADNGTSIVFTVGLTVGDVVDIICVNNLTNSSVSNAGNITYSGQFTGQTARTVAAKLTDAVSVKDFGAVGDGVTDDTAAIQAALNHGGKVYLASNVTYKVSAALDIDLSKSSLFGDGSVIDGSSSSTGVLNAFSSASFSQRIEKNWNHWIEGVAFKGTKTTGFRLIQIGHTTNPQSSEITFRNCSFFNAGRLVEFIANAWRANFDHCGFEAAEDNYLYYNAATNAAEVMRFSHCWFVDGTTAYIYLNEGQWFFEHCSFPGGGIGGLQVLGAAHVVLHGCNLETQPAVANQRIVEGYQSSHIVVDKCIIGTNGGQANQALFVIQDACSLKLTNSTLPLYGTDLRSEINDGRRVLVTGGSSYISCANNYIKGTGIIGRTDWAVFSHRNNLLNNGDAEVGSTTGWTPFAYGTPGSTFASVTTNPKNGNRHFLIDCVANGGIAVSQTLTGASAFVGRTAVFGMWAKALGGTGVVDYPTLKCLDASGTVITSYPVPVNATDTSYVWIGGYLVVPSGTDKLVFEIGGQQQAGAHQVYFDDIILNVI